VSLGYPGQVQRFRHAGVTATANRHHLVNELTAITERTADNATPAQLFLTGYSKLLGYRPSRQDQGTRRIHVPIIARHPLGTRRGLYPGYLASLEAQAILGRLILHLRGKLGTGDTLGEAWVILDHFDIHDVSTHVLPLKKKGLPVAATQVQSRSQARGAATNYQRVPLWHSALLHVGISLVKTGDPRGHPQGFLQSSAPPALVRVPRVISLVMIAVGLYGDSFM
jgi:hypothetical protein